MDAALLFTNKGYLGPVQLHHDLSHFFSLLQQMNTPKLNIVYTMQNDVGSPTEASIHF